MCSTSVERKWTPSVSLVVAYRNESNGITATLNSLTAQDYAPRLLELVLVDCGSTDNTAELVGRFAAASPGRRIRLLTSAERTTPSAFNAGIAAARGEVIFTLGAHTTYPAGYVSGAIRTMSRFDADIVGGCTATVPGSDSRVAGAIAEALSSRFGVGNSLMRTGVPAPQAADTAAYPGYRRRVFDRIGRFNPRLIRNQDMELNLRARRAGFSLVLDPAVTSSYRARATLRDLWHNAFGNGYWVIRGLKFARLPFTVRHLVPLLFASGAVGSVLLAASWLPGRVVLAASAAAYGLADLWFSLVRPRGHLSARPFDRSLLLVVFPLLHFAYGFGSLWALLTIWRNSSAGLASPTSLTRRACVAP
jgi:glycosyltransferase involved in cell wall biosynthesis